MNDLYRGWLYLGIFKVSCLIGYKNYKLVWILIFKKIIVLYLFGSWKGIFGFGEDQEVFEFINKVYK